MITFSQLGTLGRLGNQLFQYAAARALSLESNYELALPDPRGKSWQGQDCLLREFNIPGEVFKEASGIEHLVVEKDPFQYDDRFWKLPDNIDLHGFWQCTYYFDKFSDIIKKELTPKQNHLDDAKAFISSIRNKYGKPVVSVHLRRGDNTDNSNPSAALNAMYRKDGDYFKYLDEALKNFNDCTFLVFTGGKRSEEGNSNDIQWCRDNLGIEAEYSEGTTLQDFCRIMCCDHTIMSPVSSFGWWAAYLSQSKEKTIIAPDKYHPDMRGFTHREGFYPKEFIIL
jgi:hypothetical protein